MREPSRTSDLPSSRPGNMSSLPPYTAAKPNGKSHHKPAQINGHSSIPTTNGHSLVRRPPDHDRTYFGHNLEEVSRILMQGLTDMGFMEAARALSRESGYEMEPASVADFRSAILSGNWDAAEILLLGDDRFRRRSIDSGKTGRSLSPSDRGLRLRPDASSSTMLFQIRQQKFLELLEARDLGAALSVLRTELTPLNQDIAKLHELSSLLMYDSIEDLKYLADWDGTDGASRHELLSELSKSISPTIMLPDNRLATLLQDLKDRQIEDCHYHNTPDSPSLYSEHMCDGSDFPRYAAACFEQHQDEVWSLAFSTDGRRLATAGLDGKIELWNTETLEPDGHLGNHMAGVSSLRWSPNDRYMLSCDQGGRAQLWDMEARKRKLEIDTRQHDGHPEDHPEPISSCAWAPDSQSFVLGSLTKRTRKYDLQGHAIFEWQGRRTNGCDISSDGKHLVTVCRVPVMSVNIFNYQNGELEDSMSLPAEPSSVSISHDCQNVLVSVAHSQLLLYSLANREKLPMRVYAEHKHTSFDIRSSFGGAHERFVVSGSEDGDIYIWHRNNGQVLARLDQHRLNVNSVAWNPANPRMLASVSDDRTVIIWTADKPHKELWEANGHSNGAAASMRSAQSSGIYI